MLAAHDSNRDKLQLDRKLLFWEKAQPTPKINAKNLSTFDTF